VMGWRVIGRVLCRRHHLHLLRSSLHAFASLMHVALMWELLAGTN
jgi:hypothetical protein